MTTCPSCRRRPFSFWRKLTLPLGGLRACEQCGEALGLSSSVVIAYFWYAFGFVMAIRSDTWAGSGWILVGTFLWWATMWAWIPLWHVVGVESRRKSEEVRNKT